MKRSLNMLALSVAILSLSGQYALSQINNYTINQTVTASSGSFTIDADGDGNDDYTFEILQLSGNSQAARVISLGNSQVMDNSTFGYPDTLSFGDNVSSPYSGGNAVLGTDVGGSGLFSGAEIKYLGLNIDISGGSHLGWVSLEVAATNDTIILHDLGFNTVANEAISAGSVNVTSVNEIGSIDLDIYPNPCQNKISFDWPNSNSDFRYSILDITGKMMLNGAVATNIDVSILASGTYILSVDNGQNIVRKKFTKN